MFIALRIIFTALALVASRSIDNTMLPSYHGSVAGAFLLAAMLEAVVWTFGRLTGRFFKTMGLDADLLDSDSPPVGTTTYFITLLWLTASAFLRVVNHYSPGTISLTGWYSAIIGGIIWLAISFMAAVLVAKASPDISAWWATRNIISPTHADSGVFAAGHKFICYLRDTPYTWRKEADGRIIGILDRGFGWYYQVEWHNNTLVASSGRAGLIATKSQVSIGLVAEALSEDFEWLYRNARMRDALKELTERYPGQPLFKLPERYPSEIIVELERDEKMSRAIAVISQSDEHHHNVMTESYEVLRGQLSVFVNGEERAMREGDVLVITPGNKHWAKGDAAWVQVDCTPPWTPEDHILEPQK